MQPNPIYVRDKIREFINEDIGDLGIKYPETLFRNLITVRFIAGEELVVCGAQWLHLFFDQLANNSVFKIMKLEKEGLLVARGTTIAQIQSSAGLSVALEGVIVNFLSHLCGVATYTRKLLRRTEGIDIEIIDSSTTTPGLKVFEKYALSLGGAKNNSFKRFDSVAITDTDIYLFGSVARAIDFQLESSTATTGVEVQVEDPKQLERALEDYRVTCIGFTGLNAADLRSAVKVVKTIRPDIKIKVFGKTVFPIREVARTGIDAIAISDLVTRARPVKIKMRLSKS